MKDNVMDSVYDTRFLPTEAVQHINKMMLMIPMLLVILGGFLARL